MKDMEIIKLDNGYEYYVVDTLIYNDIKYILLSFVSDVKDICVRKIEVLDGSEVISYLDEEEFDIVFDMFVKKNKALYD